jgi:hypothetical protein
MVTYPEALERLRGHPRWWYFEYHGRTDERVRQEAIELASLPNIEEHLQQAAMQPQIAKPPCGSC